MREFIRISWLPTTLFTAATLPYCLANWQSGWALSIGPTLTAVVVVLVVWYAYVVGPGRRRLGRAALAGASAAYMIITLSHVLNGVRFSLTHSWSSLELGAFAVGLADLICIVGGLLVGSPIGALLGLAVARAQRSDLDRASSRAENTGDTRRSALTATMTVVLLSPVLAYLTLDVSQESLSALATKYAIGYSVGLAATWMVWIPLAAFLGARRVLATLFSRRTWIRTMALFASAVVIGSTYGVGWALLSGITCVILTTLLWPEGANRGGRAGTQRGAAAGVAIGFVSQLVPAVVAMLSYGLTTAALGSGGGVSHQSSPGAVSYLLTAITASLVVGALGGVLARSSMK